MFEALVAPFDTPVRNAISHKPQEFIDPIRQKVIFLDRKNSKKNVEMDFSDFLAKTREFSSDVYIVSMIGAAIHLRSIKQMKEHFKDLIPEPPQQ